MRFRSITSLLTIWATMLAIISSPAACAEARGMMAQASMAEMDCAAMDASGDHTGQVDEAVEGGQPDSDRPTSGRPAAMPCAMPCSLTCAGAVEIAGPLAMPPPTLTMAEPAPLRHLASDPPFEPPRPGLHIDIT